MPDIVRCPTCRTETPWRDNPFRPFCSERCRRTDLGAWAAEKFRIPGEPVDVADLESADDAFESDTDPPVPKNRTRH